MDQEIEKKAFFFRLTASLTLWFKNNHHGGTVIMKKKSEDD